MPGFACALVPFTELAAERWPGVLDQAVELGLPGVMLDLVWRTHERGVGRADFSGARDVRRFLGLAAGRGLWAAVRLGPLFAGESGLGLPERVLGARACQAMGPRGAPRFAPCPWRLVPAPDLGAPALVAELEGWLEVALGALARAAADGHGPRAAVLDLTALLAYHAPPAGALLAAAERLSARVRARLPGVELLQVVGPRAPAELALGLAAGADGLGAPLRAGRGELDPVAARCAGLRALGHAPLGLPLPAGVALFGPVRALDDHIFTSLAGLMHGLEGFALESLVDRRGWTGAPLRADGAPVAEPADWVRRLLRLCARLAPWRLKALGHGGERGLPEVGDPELLLAWHGPAGPEAGRPAEGPGCLWLANPTAAPRSARLRLPAGLQPVDVWRRSELGARPGELEVGPHRLRPLEIAPC